MLDGKQTSKSYRDLVAWQRAMDLAEVVYRATQSWPKAELYGLTSQKRRAAVSIPSNIAEGQGRSSPQEFLHFLRIARGSLMEVETQLLLAQRLGYLQDGDAKRALQTSDEVSRLLTRLSQSLSNK